MADMKRYEKRVNPINGSVYMACIPDGAYVLYDDHVAALAQQAGAVAQGRVNGYLLSARAIEVIVDGDIPEWMTARPGLRVTIASSAPGGGGEVGNEA